MCKRDGVTDLKYAPPRIVYHAELGRSRSNRVRVSIGEPAKLGFARASRLEMEGVSALDLH